MLRFMLLDLCLLAETKHSSHLKRCKAQELLWRLASLSCHSFCFLLVRILSLLWLRAVARSGFILPPISSCSRWNKTVYYITHHLVLCFLDIFSDLCTAALTDTEEADDSTALDGRFACWTCRDVSSPSVAPCLYTILDNSSISFVTLHRHLLRWRNRWTDRSERIPVLSGLLQRWHNTDKIL